MLHHESSLIGVGRDIGVMHLNDLHVCINPEDIVRAINLITFSKTSTQAHSCNEAYLFHHFYLPIFLFAFFIGLLFCLPVLLAYFHLPFLFALSHHGSTLILGNSTNSSKKFIAITDSDIFPINGFCIKISLEFQFSFYTLGDTGRSSSLSSSE